MFYRYEAGGNVNLTCWRTRRSGRLEGMDRAGIMARRTLTGRSGFVFVHDSPEPDGARILRRTTHGGDNSEEPASLDTHPEWYRLRRSGDSITCYYSTNGRSWRAIGSFNSGRTIWNNGEAVYVGFALTSSGEIGRASRRESV